MPARPLPPDTSALRGHVSRSGPRFLLLTAGVVTFAVLLALHEGAEADDHVQSVAIEERTATVTPLDRVAIDVSEDSIADDVVEVFAARLEPEAVAPPPAAEPVRLVGPTPLSTWEAVARCESGYGGEPDWSIDTGNGFYGGLQFTLDSWRWVGGDGYPHEASKAEQIARAEILLERQGWRAWPACSRMLGLR